MFSGKASSMFQHLLQKTISLSRQRRDRSSRSHTGARRRLNLERLESRDLPAPLTWAAGTSLPDARGGLVAVQGSSHNTVILGGSTTDIFVPTFAAANPAWKTVMTYTTPLDQSRSFLGAGVLADGTILIFGGVASEGETTSSAYDFFGNPSAPASMSTQRSSFGFATDENHHVYAIGGGGGDGGGLSSAEYFDQASNTWTTIAPLPQGLSGLSAAADLAGHVFVFGGTDGSGNLSATVYRYTIATNIWDTVAPLPVATTGSAAVLASNGLIYVLGGVTSSGTTANVESYNESTNTWTTETPLPAPVSSEAATSDSLGRIVVAGGFDASGNATASTYFSQELNQPDAAPVITTSAPTRATANQAYTYQVLSTGNPQPTYTLTTAPAGMTIDSNTGLISWTPTQSQVGYQTVTVQASNYAGHVSQTYSVAVIGLPPSGLTATGASASSIALSWNASTDPGGVSGYNVYEKFTYYHRHAPPTYTYTLLASGLTTTSYTVTGLATGSTHTYVVTDVGAVTGLETAYSVPATAQTWYPPSFPQAPAFLLSNGALFAGPVNVTENQTVQITLLGVGNPLAYSVLSGPTTVSIDPNTGVVTYTPASSEVGQVNITFEASNSLGTATQTVTFNVLPAPTIIFNDGPFTFNGYPFYATATALGSDGVTPVSGTFTFTYSGPSNPPSFAGSYLVTAYFTSSDPNYGNTTATSTMIINPAPAVFGHLLSPTIPVGKPSVTLSGTLLDNALGSGPASGTVNVTLNGVTQAATLGSGDTFSTTFTTSSLAAGAYTVTYAYVPGDTDFTALNATSTLYVGAKPAVTLNPRSQTVTAGNSVTFTTAATGTPAPKVQWQVSTDGGRTYTNISGATSATLTFTTIASENLYKYRAVFTNALGTVTTSTATLTVQFAPIITTNPTNLTVTAGHTATFTAAASANPKATVQWQVSADGGNTFTNITGATSTTYRFTATAAQNGDEYRAVFTNTLGTTTTTAATLTVDTVPIITTQPTNQTVAAGNSVSFTAAASGNPAPTVQWQVSTDGGLTFSIITGATNTTLSFFATAVENGYRYRAVFTNPAGTATTTAAILTS
jgi:N-acetylneuraminic acid mutarotase